MQAALIILVHDSVPCSVKAGKADTITGQECAAIQRQLLMHTNRIANDINADKFIFSSKEKAGDNIYFKKGYKKRMQRGRSTGEKMLHAFETVLSMGYDRVVLTGTGSVETEAIHLYQAFNALNNYDVVIGPAKHGNYYLLGMKKLHPFLFEKNAFHLPVLLDDAITQISLQGLTYHLQPLLDDAEEEHEKYLLHHRQ